MTISTENKTKIEEARRLIGAADDKSIAWIVSKVVVERQAIPLMARRWHGEGALRTPGLPHLVLLIRVAQPRVASAAAA